MVLNKYILKRLLVAFFCTVYCTGCEERQRIGQDVARDSLDAARAFNITKEYSEAMCTADVEILKKYFYEDTWHYYNRFLETPCSREEFFQYYLYPMASNLKDLQNQSRKMGYKLIIDVNRLIGKKTFGDLQVFCFVLDIKKIKDRDTTFKEDRIMVFIEGDKNEVLAPVFNSIPILKNRLSYNDVIDLLDFACDDNFEVELLRENKRILAEGRWDFVAVGLNRDKVRPLKSAHLTGLSNSVLADLPVSISLDDSALVINGTFGNSTVQIPLQLTHNRIALPCYSKSRNLYYEISENGKDVYYMDIVLQEDGKDYWLLYEKQ